MVLIFICTLLHIFVISTCDEALLLRGVSPNKSFLYDPLKDFTCFDGSISIPFSFVNDDYCDCEGDGSDEPGTSACQKGVFYCSNKGHIPIEISSAWVNDGICDCCDGSDEYLTNKCHNVCELRGSEARQEAERLNQLLLQGSQVRLQMIAAGKRILQEKKERLANLENDKDKSFKIKEEVFALKRDAESLEFAALEVYRAKEEEEKAQKAAEEQEEEKKEALDLFTQIDSNNDKRLQFEEIRTRQSFDHDKDGIVTDTEIKFFFNNDDIAWEEFYELVWPRYKPVHMKERGLFIPPRLQKENEETETPSGTDDENKEKDWDKDGDSLDDHEIVDHEEGEHEEEEEESKDEAVENVDADPKYDEKTLQLIEEAKNARTNFERTNREYQDLEREFSQLKDSLSKDFGSENEFVALDGECFAYNTREYTYKFCPFDQVIQTGKSGGSETRLGTWAGWVAEGDYSAMIYNKGQSCWNGPQRSSKILFSCGVENQMISATEPNKCEYLFEFKTPAACKYDKIKDTHDEL